MVSDGRDQLRANRMESTGPDTSSDPDTSSSGVLMAEIVSCCQVASWRYAWLDGWTWHLHSGVEFHVSAINMRSLAYSQARRHGMRLHTKRLKDGRLIIRAYPRT